MAAPDSDAPYVGHWADGEHRFAVRTYYEDTDAGGVVYHARYLAFFERARTDMLVLAGVDFLGTAAAGEGFYVVAEAHLKYRKPARLGDALVIASRIESIRPRLCVIQQRVMREGQLLVDGRMTIVFVDADGRAQRQPESWIAAFEALMGAEQTG